MAAESFHIPHVELEISYIISRDLSIKFSSQQFIATAGLRFIQLEIMSTYPTDDQDFQNASYGLKGFIDPCVIHSGSDSSVVIWDNASYESFINDEATCPTEVNQSLFRQSQLCVKQGLFEVVKDKIYQVRGLDISNITFVETINSNGVVVIDPLCSVETAKRAIDLYQGYRRDKIILAMIYTHSHADHFGGGLAVVGMPLFLFLCAFSFHS